MLVFLGQGFLFGLVWFGVVRGRMGMMGMVGMDGVDEMNEMRCLMR